jgi:hypothetical protein
MFMSIQQLVLTSIAATPVASNLLDVSFADDASFKVSLGGSHWLSSAPVRVFTAGAWGALTKTGATHSEGSDILGDFSCVNVSWLSGSTVLHTSLKQYTGKDTAVFVQQLPRGATHTNASNPVLPGGLRVMDPGAYPPVVAFPSFTGGRLETLGYLTWQSRMLNAEWGVNVTSGPAGTNEPLINGSGLQGLSTSGPVVLYDSDSEQFSTLVVGPMDNFKTAVHTVRSTAADGAPAHAVWETGVSSELTSLPAGFEHRTLIVAGSGITATLDSFGQALRASYGTNRTSEADLNINYLSYWSVAIRAAVARCCSL